MRRVAHDGTLGTVTIIARTDVSRSSSFPRMACLGDTVYFEWTQFGKPSVVRTATTDVSTFEMRRVFRRHRGQIAAVAVTAVRV